MSYVDENLLPGEHVLHRAQVHPIIYAPGYCYLAVAAAIALYMTSMPAGTSRSGTGFMALAMLLTAVFMLTKAYIYIANTEFVVTNTRVIAKTGWMSRNVVELRHDKIEGLTMQQTVNGRMLGYGTLILSGTGGDKTYISTIANPSQFCNHAMTTIAGRGN